MAAVDSFDTKSFFFFFQIDCGGGGATQSRPTQTYVNIAPACVTRNVPKLPLGA